VNEYGPPPDWEAVFHRARRRIFGRLLLVGVFAALGAALLLNGGLAAQGSAPWMPINNKGDEKAEPSEGKHHQEHHRKHHRQQGRPGEDQGHDGEGNEKGKKKPERHKHKQDKHGGHNQWGPCGGDSAGTQYCDAPPQTPDGGSTGKVDASHSDTAPAGDVAVTTPE